MTQYWLGDLWCLLLRWHLRGLLLMSVVLLIRLTSCVPHRPRPPYQSPCLHWRGLHPRYSVANIGWLRCCVELPAELLRPVDLYMLLDWTTTCQRLAGVHGGKVWRKVVVLITSYSVCCTSWASSAQAMMCSCAKHGPCPVYVVATWLLLHS